MKLIKKICPIVILLTIGCTKMLEKEPIGVVSENSAYVSENDAIQAIVAAYNVNISYTMDNYSIYDIVTDNALKGGEGPADGDWMFDLANFNVNSSNFIAQDSWANGFLGVHRSNLVIENVPKINMDENKKNRIIGEAKFLRAYHYFSLVKLFGDVPLITDAQVDANQVRRVSKDSVWALVIKDLTEAANVLPLRSALTSNELVRATKGAAEAYLAKAYLYQKNFQQAELWFNKVIESNEYSLDPDFYHIFTIDGEFGSENIFEINHTYSAQFKAAENHGTICQGSAGMYGYGFCCPSQDFVDEFEPGDPRLWQTVYKQGQIMPDGLIADVGNSETGYMSLKPYLNLDEYPPTGNPSNSPKNFIKYRYGMLLLWYAEAANENGNSTQALWALNEVRKRARQGNTSVLPDVTTTDKDQLRTAIWHEQRVEYGMENERFFDLVRQGRAGTVLRAYSQKYNTAKGSFKDGVNEVLPIPQTEIDLSQGKLTQNNGY
jgi:tetratricopeptide (TPR) repeat protein